MVWEQTTWWLVGAAALAFTAMSLVGLRTSIVGLFVADASAIILWIIWAINAFAVKQVTNSGVEIIHNYPSLGYAGVAMAFVVGLDLAMTVLEAIRGRPADGAEESARRPARG